MKRLLLIGLILSCAAAFAQQNRTEKAIKMLSHVNPELLKIKVPAPTNKNIDNAVPVNNNTSLRKSLPTTQGNPAEAIIGTTYYDLQTNNAISNRLVNNADGTMSAVWTFSPNFTAGYPSRGTGYNYFNGTSWNAPPTTRIENVRAGFTNVGITASGEEVVIAHGIQSVGSSLGMLLTTRPAKGTGLWSTNTDILGEEPADTIDVWSKLAIGGSDGKSIHSIWRGGSINNPIAGQTGPIFYSRSTDDGTTWDKIQTLLPEISSTYYLGFSADEYAIDARDSVIAIVAGALGTDVVLLKSTDNGNSWTKTIVDRFPIPLFDGGSMDTDSDQDGIIDTLRTGTGDANLVIDNNYKVHVFYTNVRSIGTGTSYSYFPLTTLLYYWNESMGPDYNSVPIARAPDLDGSGLVDYPANNTSNCPNDPFPYGNYGTTNRPIEEPTAGVDANNNIYVCYQAADEFSEAGAVSGNNDKLFKHPYIMGSADGGANWSSYDQPFDVLNATQGANGELYEGVFACLAKRVDTQLHIIYQRDQYPGHSLAAASTCDASLNPTNNSNDIIYVGIDAALIIGIPQLPSTAHGLVLSANYPNPASDFTRFKVTLNKALSVKIDVEDIYGQKVYSENKGKLSEGAHTVTLNTSYLSSGVYFYTVTAGNEKVTGKMVVE